MDAAAAAMRGTGPRPSLSEFERLRRQLRRALVALLLVILVGVTGFSVIGAPEHGVVDAVYMTVITLTTVGYGEIIEMSHRPEGRVFTVLLLLVGMGIFAYSLPLLTAFVVEGQLTHIFERGRMQKQLSRPTAITWSAAKPPRPSMSPRSSHAPRAPWRSWCRTRTPESLRNNASARFRCWPATRRTTPC
jgi:hypothetical protein